MVAPIMTRMAHLVVRALAVCAMAAIAVMQFQRLAPPASGLLPLQVPDPALATIPALFPPSPDGAPAADQPLPELIGIAGRLGADAEALVRTAPGKSETLRIGDSTLGWTVTVIGADSVTFERDGARSVVKLKRAP